MNTNKLTRDELGTKVNQAFKAFYNHASAEAADTLEAILDAIRSDLEERMHECGNYDDIASNLNDYELAEAIGDDPMKAFSCGRFAYSFNPFKHGDKSREWYDSADYFAFDGYGKMCSIENNTHLACWYECNISDYLDGNYGEPDPDAMQQLAEVFDCDFDDEQPADDDSEEA